MTDKFDIDQYGNIKRKTDKPISACHWAMPEELPEMLAEFRKSMDNMFVNDRKNACQNLLEKEAKILEDFAKNALEQYGCSIEDLELIRQDIPNGYGWRFVKRETQSEFTESQIESMALEFMNINRETSRVPAPRVTKEEFDEDLGIKSDLIFLIRNALKAISTIKGE